MNQIIYSLRLQKHIFVKDLSPAVAMNSDLNPSIHSESYMYVFLISLCIYTHSYHYTHSHIFYSNHYN